MKIIGLTGGIGTGKSTVSSYLAQKGCYIIDADKISREMTMKGAPALDDILEVFGKSYFDEEGNLNRKKLGDLVFREPAEKAKLEKIITQRVIKQTHETIEYLAKSGFKGIVVVDAPLLFEFGMEKIVDESWLVTAALEKRIERIIERDGLTKEQILARINNQMSQDMQEKLSNYIIDNSGSVDELKKEIDFHLERIINE